jgi:DNA-binding NtrC family response regulator
MAPHTMSTALGVGTVYVLSRDPEVQRIINSSLDLLKTPVKIFTEDDEILEALDLNNPLLIVLDIDIPGLRWEPLVEGIRLDHPNASLVIVSEKSPLWGISRVLQKTSCRYLSKPMQPEGIVQLMEDSLLMKSGIARLRKPPGGVGAAEVQQGGAPLAVISENLYRKSCELIDPIFDQVAQTSWGQIFYGLTSAFEKALVAAALRYCNSNQVKASQLLGISRNTLRDRIEKFKLS